MAMDGITVAAIARELDAVLAGAKINKITQSENDELCMTIRQTTDNRTVRLLLSASASLPLACLTETNRPGPAQAPAFCMLLRKHLQGGRIRHVTQPGIERILRIDVDGTDEMGDACTHTLILELMGKYSNIILIDGDDRILDSIRRVSASMSSVREVLPGRPYFVPPQDKISPLSADATSVRTAIRGQALPLAKAVYTSVAGISPLLAQELCVRADIDADRPAISLSDEEYDRFYTAFSGMIQDLQADRFAPQIVLLDGVPAEYAPVPLTMYAHTPGAVIRPYTSVSALVEDFYRERAAASRIRQRAADLRHLVTTALQRNRKTLDLQQKQLSDADKMERYRLFGELLQAYGHQAAPAARSVEVENYHTGEPLTIPLDPQLSAQENAVRYFERYRKLKRTAEALAEQTERVRMDIAHLESVEEALALASSEADLLEIRRELALAGYIKNSAAHGNGKRTVREKPVEGAPLHYRTVDDFDGLGPFDLYVGKNNLQNDRLTFKLANGGDWWFHAKKAPGSHVVLRTGGVSDDRIPDRVFEMAAALAAHYSKAGEQTLTEIDYLHRRDVKKPAGAKPGYVVYYTNYSMSVRPGTDGLVLTDQ